MTDMQKIETLTKNGYVVIKFLKNRKRIFWDKKIIDEKLEIKIANGLFGVYKT
jgi:hypothetical protein